MKEQLVLYMLFYLSSTYMSLTLLYTEYCKWDQRYFLCFQAAEEAAKDNLENEVEEAKSRMQQEEHTKVSHYIYISVP